ncbi:torsin-1A-interacting protein 2-like [Seriola aureovittata]|uniref:torsin-1A-interacting protein 2-like n=1 Tax=Seriola aureovittata TaxID=2871759 RepID=UPI0024BDD9FF|nr:torsin-1A-interacting protein 2-like [Seriola aureovittata]
MAEQNTDINQENPALEKVTDTQPLDGKKVEQGDGQKQVSPGSKETDAGAGGGDDSTRERTKSEATDTEQRDKKVEQEDGQKQVSPGSKETDAGAGGGDGVTGENLKKSETTNTQPQDEQEDGQKQDSRGSKDTHTGAGGDDGRGPERELHPEDKDVKDNRIPQQKPLLQEEEMDKQGKNIENICPTTQETTDPTLPDMPEQEPNFLHTGAGRDNEGVPEPDLPSQFSDKQEDKTVRKRVIQQKKENTENVGPITQETTETTTGGRGMFWIYLLIVGIAVAAIVAILYISEHLHQSDPPPQKEDVAIRFINEMKKVENQFPNQRPELWGRSRIHLLRHLQTAQPTEPVSLILTAGLRAEKTLRCLALGVASAFSSALNVSVLHINGSSKASQDSDQVKLDIDSKLQGAFEGDKPVAVIHRFEELPPGSTLIFYRYCDHENAAYKKTFLMFTVLLGEEEEIPAKISLSAVEEMVDDHLQKKFLSHGRPVSFDRMDLDKYGGLWSRISHLILPVAAVERMEHKGCT